MDGFGQLPRQTGPRRGIQKIPRLRRCLCRSNRSEHQHSVAASMDKRTALFPVHQQLGAKLIPFGGWTMPVEYAGIAKEHTAVRTAAGLFDVSHMGEFEITGPQALDLVRYVTSNDASRLSDGQAQYSVLP